MRVFKNGATNPVDDPDTPLNPFIMPEVTKHNTTGQATYTIQIDGFHSEDFTPSYMYQLNVENITLSLHPNPTNEYLNILFDAKKMK